MLTIFSTNNPSEISFAKSLLSDAGIPSYVADVYTSNIEGSIGAIPQRLMVAERDFEDAKKLLIDAELGL